MAKGKIVKQWNTFGVDQQGEHTNVKVPISLTVGDGCFHIPLPDYVCGYFGRSINDNTGHGNDWRGYNDHDKEVAASTMSAVESLYERVIRLYSERVKNDNRRKVILVNFKATRSHRRTMDTVGGVVVTGSDMDHLIAEMSFAKGPALELTHSVLWETGGRLYSVSEYADEPPRMTYIAAAPDASHKGKRSSFMLEWTEEREAFFVNAQTGLNTLIAQIAHMLLGDVSTNVDRLIAGGGLLALPAPVRVPDDMDDES